MSPDSLGPRYGNGYNIHPIQANHAGQDVTAWTEGRVIALNADEHVLTIERPDGTQCRFWRSAFGPFKDLVGQTIAVCEPYHLLGVGNRWFSVKVLDPRPRQEPPGPPAADSKSRKGRAVIVNLATGEALVRE